MNKRLLIDIAKYALAVALLAWVVHANWAPPPTKASATLAASTLGLCASPAGPLVAASCAFPGRTESRGLGYVWQRHVSEGLPIHAGFLFTAVGLYLAATLVTLLRWYILVRALDLPLRLRDAFRYGFIGVFFNTFLPGSVGGDIIKAAALARTQNRRAHAVATVIMDRLIALWALVWFVALSGAVFWLAGMLTGPAGGVARTIVATALLTVAVTGGIWLLLGLLPERRADRFAGRLQRLPLVGATVSEFWRAAWVYRQKQASVALVMLLSWVGQVGFVIGFYCAARTLWSQELGSIPTFVQHFLLVPIGLVMQALVPTPGGAGGGEWGFAALYLLFRAGEANGVLASLIARVITWLLGLLAAVGVLWLRPQTPPLKVVLPEPSGELLPGAPLPASPQSVLAG